MSTVVRCFSLLGPALALLLGACERRVVLGDLESVGLAGASAGGNQGFSGSGSGGATGGGSVVFSSGFETGDLSEWGETGSSRAVAGGELAVLQGTAHGGSSSLLVTTEQVGEHVVLGLPADYSEYVFGFWLLIPQSFASLNWVVLNVDETLGDGSIGELFDLALRVDGASPRLFVWEKPSLNGSDGGLEIGASSEPLPIGLWFHVEVALRVSTEATGQLQVFEGGRLTIDLPNRPTSTGGVPRLGVGSFAHELQPLPARLWLDDITLSTP